MGAMQILITLELRSYRESIAAVFRTLRPHVEVFEAEQEDLDREVLRLRPDLVVCSRVTSLVQSDLPHWVELYLDHHSRSVVCIEGECSTVEDIQLADLLSVIDRVEFLDLR